MGRPGFEPGTNRLKAEYSTVELATLSFYRLCHHSIVEWSFVKSLEKIYFETHVSAVAGVWFQHSQALTRV